MIHAERIIAIKYNGYYIYAPFRSVFVFIFVEIRFAGFSQISLLFPVNAHLDGKRSGMLRSPCLDLDENSYPSFLSNQVYLSEFFRVISVTN